MSGISIWITSILAVVIIGVVVDLLMHNSRMHKFIRGVFGFITLFIIVSPIPNLIKTGFDFDNIFDFGGSFTLDQNYLDIINARKIRLLEQGVEDLLTTKGVSGATVKLNATVDGVEITVQDATVDITNASINSDIGNKPDYITKIVADALQIDFAQVRIVGS